MKMTDGVNNEISHFDVLIDWIKIIIFIKLKEAY
jgi:hypothetical protein